MIEKLGITPIEIREFNYNITKDPVYVVYPDKVRKVEKQHNEMLEMLIDVYEGFWIHNSHCSKEMKKLIEKATGRKWAEVKELIEEQEDV